jgi:molybdenum cofactor biosynthesis protein MoaC
MIDISEKFPTLRTAVAFAKVKMLPETVLKIFNNDLPKQDPLTVAKYAGIQAAKKTSELIPACHQVPLDFIDIEIKIISESSTAEILATVKAEYKTGIEMEALTAAAVAALTLYDMLKPVDKTIVINEIKLIEKTGGINSIPCSGDCYEAAVVVVSDSTAAGTREDKSGKAALSFLTDLGFKTKKVFIVSDDKKEISNLVFSLVDNVDLIVTTGGTGLGPRDNSCEVLKKIIEKNAVGIAEWIRAYGRLKTPRAILSNSIAGVHGKTLIIGLPGSVAGVLESLTALKPTLSHALDMINGKGH